MMLEERSDLILAFAQLLFANGQSTDQTLAAASKLGDTLGLRVGILPRWGELQLQADDKHARLISTVAVDPTGVNMERVASATRAIDQHGLRSAAGGDMAFHACGCGGRGGVGGDLWRTGNQSSGRERFR
jgi:hypothetical protein